MQTEASTITSNSIEAIRKPKQICEKKIKSRGRREEMETIFYSKFLNIIVKEALKLKHLK